jgi:uncharacterized protein (DUF1697 family)
MAPAVRITPRTVGGSPMPRYVALLQGINVGKHKRVAMVDLKALVERLGHTDVATHLNSGNVVFTADAGTNAELAGAIEGAIATKLGLDVPVVVRSGEELARIVANNPFPEAAADHTTLHVTFLGAMPDPERVAALAEVDRGDDDYRGVGADVYLSYPNKLTGATFMPTGLGKALGVVATSRNWRTVTRLAELANGQDSRGTARK